MHKKVTKSISSVAAIALGLALANSTYAESQVDYTKMTAKELAEYLLFETNSFNLDQPVQEGGTAKEPLVQDEIQKICTEARGKPTDPDAVAKVSQLARESIKYPEGGIKLNDWEIGRELAWSGCVFC